jgi:DNA-binding transcriptional LysR family regulator
MTMNLFALNLNLLPILDALLGERSVSGAGRRLGMSQPAVSSALAQLRVLFDDELFVRSGNAMVPTERALSLAAPLRSALITLADALAPSATFEPKTLRRSFVIVTTDFVAFVLLPRLLARLEREAPGIELQIRAWPHHRVSPELDRGDADLMLGFYSDLPPRHFDQVLFEDRFVCAVRKGHPRVKGKLSLSSYLELSHVLVSHDREARGVVDEALGERGLERRIGLRVSHFLLVPPILAETNYVAALSELIARPFARRLPLQVLPSPVPLPVAYVRQVWHARTHNSPAHVWLRATIAEVARGVAQAKNDHSG